jgi:hypothetical protein
VQAFEKAGVTVGDTLDDVVERVRQLLNAS